MVFKERWSPHVQRSKSIAKELLGPNQVERWSLYRGQNQGSQLRTQTSGHYRDVRGTEVKINGKGAFVVFIESYVHGLCLR